MIEKVVDWRHCPVCDERVEFDNDYVFINEGTVLVFKDGTIKRLMQCEKCDVHWWVVYKPTNAYRHVFKDHSAKGKDKSND